jgi:hypothetical protein
MDEDGEQEYDSQMMMDGDALDQYGVDGGDDEY